MARFLGDQAFISWKFESGTYGSADATAQWPGQVTEHSIDENTNVTALRYAGGGTRNVEQFLDGPIDYTGTLTCRPNDWKFFVLALGSNIDAGSPSPYTHTISELESNNSSPFISGTLNPFTSFQIEDCHRAPGTGLNFVRTLQGCVVNSLSISASQGEPITAELNYIAQDIIYSSGAPTAVTDPATRPFQWRDVKLHIPSGTVYDAITEFSLELNNNLEPPHYLNGSRVISVPIPQNRDYTLSVTLHSTSERVGTLYNEYFIGGSTFNAMLEVNASTGSRDAFFIMSGCKVIDMESPTTTEGVLSQTLTIQPQNVVVKVNDLIQLYSPF